MKLDRIKVAFGAATVVLLGTLIACGGDDDEEPGTGSSGTSGTTSTSGTSGASGTSGTSGTTSSGASGTTSSSSGGANSCALAYGCVKTTITNGPGGAAFVCDEGTTTKYRRESAPEPVDATAPESDASSPCNTDGSDPSQCLTKLHCEIAGSVTDQETKVENDGKKSTTTSSATYANDAGSCNSTTVREVVDDAECDVVDAGGDAGDAAVPVP